MMVCGEFFWVFVMDITPLISADQQVIQSYSKGCFKINQIIYDSPVIVYTDRVEPWEFGGGFNGLLSDIAADDFEPLFKNATELDIVLFGCSTSFSVDTRKLVLGLKEKGLVVDVMDTGAACRTYNVLMADGRRVAAALIPVQ